MDLPENCKPLYIWHYDYYLSRDAPDAFSSFDAERIADELASTGANTVAIFALNQHGYAYYPSLVAPVHPYLGDRDYTGSMIEALHRRGVSVLTYVNYMNIDRREAHPEWWQRSSDGNQVYLDGWGLPCPNSPIREYLSAVVREVAERYPTDGFFFDMYFYNRSGCWCDYCRTNWAATHERAFPLCEDWGSESWREFIEFRNQSAIATMRAIRDAAKAARPGILWVTHGNTDDNWFTGREGLDQILDDMIQSEVPTRKGKGRWAAGQRAKLLQPYARGKQTVTILADLHCYWDKPRGWFYTPWSVTHVKRQVAEIIAHGSWPSIFTEPYPDGRNDPCTVEGIREAYAMARNLEPYLVGAETVKSVALHYSRPSLSFYGKGSPEAYRHSFDGAYKALLESHVPFDVVMDEQILDGSVREYDLCILSNSVCASDALNTALRDYVGTGGSLLATYKTSLHDEHGRQRPDFGLHDMLGVSYRSDLPAGYIRALDPMAKGLSPSPLIQHRLLRARALSGGAALGKVMGLSPTDLAPFTYVPAPSAETEWPALVKKGSVIYCAADIGYTFMRAGCADHLQLVANCVESLVGERLPLRVVARGSVDVAFRRQGRRLLVHLVNLSTNQIVEEAECEADAYQTVPLCDIELWLRADLGVEGAHSASDGAALPRRREGDWTVVSVPRLELYEIVVLESKERR